MKTLAISNVLSVAALGLAVGFSTPSAAEQVDETFVRGDQDGMQSISIQYTASELADEKSLQNLYGQIKRAAKQVCGPTSLREAGGLQLASRNRVCYEEAVSAAVSQVDSDQLASISH